MGSPVALFDVCPRHWFGGAEDHQTKLHRLFFLRVDLHLGNSDKNQRSHVFRQEECFSFSDIFVNCSCVATRWK